MKKLLLMTTLLLTQLTFAQSLPTFPFPPSTDDASKEIKINCTSQGTGFIPLQISFTSKEKLKSLSTGTLVASGQNLYVFPVSVTNINSTVELLSFNFKGIGKDIEGTFEINLENGQPSTVGVVDLTVRPIVGATVFDKYNLSNCSGSIK